MNPRIKTLWLKALRSGEYLQGTLNLITENGATEFCCLGVLCDIQRKEKDIGFATWWKGKTKDTSDMSVAREAQATLPESTRKWAGLDKNNPLVEDVSLASLNDGGTTFAEIADIIEEEL